MSAKPKKRAKRKPRRVVLSKMWNGNPCPCLACEAVKANAEYIGKWKVLQLVAEVLK